MLLVVGIFIFLISGYYPHITEKIYSSLIYKILGQTISSFTGILSFSLAEVIIVFSAFFMAGYLIKTVADVIKGPKRKKVLKRFTVNLMAIAGIIYFSFQILWGINYNRIELTEMLGLKTEAPTQEELVGLCEDLIARANQLREGLKEDHRGVMELPYGKVEALIIAHKGFERASSYYPHLDGKYGNPKGLVLSKPMSYTGITGFFFPFTGEANINMAIPEPLFAFTVTHEMAHQRGFAREEEANFIAYITCLHHPDQYFRYAGTLSALIYSMNALGKSDEGKYRELLDTLGEGVTRDWKFNSEYWNRHSGPIEQASDKINDTYLKTQNQRAGVESYGAMVDLLIAEYRGRTVSQLPDGTTEIGEIPFELDKTKAMGHTFSRRINRTIKIDGGKMRLETIKASPTTTIVKGKLQNIVELALAQITNQRIRPMGLDIRLIANGEELPWRSSGIRTDFKGINFETTYDPLPMELESLQICLAGITADYDVNQQFPLIKEGEKTSLTVLGQKVDIDEVYEADGETYITITTEESVLLSKVYLLIDGKKIPLEETISDEVSTDGNHTRTLRFSGVGGELQLKIQSIEYEKAYDAMVDILVK